MICFMGVVSARATSAGWQPDTWRADPSSEDKVSQAQDGFAVRGAAATTATPKPYSYYLSSIEPSGTSVELYSYPTSYADPSVQDIKPENEGFIATATSVPLERAYSWEIGMPEEAWGAPDGVWENEDDSEEDFDLGFNNVRAEPLALLSSAASSASSENLLDMTDTKVWLSSLSDTVCYDAIIDAYRLRVEDEYALSGKTEVGSLYAHDFPLTHFIRFIELARRESILPDSWTPERSVACQQIALDEGGDACILYAVDKDYIRDKYKNSDPIVVDVLRMFAGKVYGRALFSSGLRFFSGGDSEEGWWA